jgi:hypothetical protein
MPIVRIATTTGRNPSSSITKQNFPFNDVPLIIENITITTVTKAQNRPDNMANNMILNASNPLRSRYNLNSGAATIMNKLIIDK